MASSARVFSMITLLAPRLMAKCASTSVATRAAVAVNEASTATTRKPRRFYKTWAEFWGANGAKAHHSMAQEIAGARAQRKSSFVSTLVKRHSKSSNISRKTKKHMSHRAETAVKKVRRRSATTKTKKAAAAAAAAAEKEALEAESEKNEVTHCMTNYETASHALVLARLNNTMQRNQVSFGTPGIDSHGELTSNLGVFLKGYAPRRQEGAALVSFADHVKQAQQRMLLPINRFDCSTQKMGVSGKASTSMVAPKLLHSAGKKVDVPSTTAGVSTTAQNTAPARGSKHAAKHTHGQHGHGHVQHAHAHAPPKKPQQFPRHYRVTSSPSNASQASETSQVSTTSTIASVAPTPPPQNHKSFSTRGNVRGGRRMMTTAHKVAPPPEPEPSVEELEAAADDTSTHRDIGVEKNMMELRRFQKNNNNNPNADSTKFSYQPARLPTMRSLMKGYRDQNYEEVLTAQKQTRVPRADDGKNIARKRQLPQINMNDKCPMDDFIVQKTQPRVRYSDTAQSFRS